MVTLKELEKFLEKQRLTAGAESDDEVKFRVDISHLSVTIWIMENKDGTPQDTIEFNG